MLENQEQAQLQLMQGVREEKEQRLRGAMTSSLLSCVPSTLLTDDALPWAGLQWNVMRRRGRSRWRQRWSG